MAGDVDMVKLQRYTGLSEVFTPGAPVSNRDLFSGRLDQVFQVVSAVRQPGRHVVLYGERGVGKTSLSNLIGEFLPDGKRAFTRVNCTTQDSFKSIWSKVLRQLGVPVPDEWTYATPDPDDVRSLVEGLPKSFMIVLDEFDRVEDDEALSLMADTIKALSDHAVQSKLIIVGVATSIDELIGEHESVKRAIEEVLMPRMTFDELTGIIDRGLRAVDLGIEERARQRIGRLAEGLPTYVHLLSLSAAQSAVMDDRDEVSAEDVRRAVEATVQRHSLLREYQAAVQSPRRHNLFARVLAACALAEKNKLGQFTAGAVRKPLSRIMGSEYDIPAFAPHLNAFTSDDRGRVLVREGPERRHTYRFREPLLQPYAVLASLSDGSIPEDYVSELLG